MGKTKHDGPMSLNKKLQPALWAGITPFGLGKVKPHHIKDTLDVIIENKDSLPYAYRILTKGVCDGCALGVLGLQDQTLSGLHLCSTRLNMLRINTMSEMEEHWLTDVEKLKSLSNTELRKLGRIPFPLLRKKGENSFFRLSWDEALNRIASKIQQTKPEQLAFYLTARGITNEVYYAAAKAARYIGTNHIDNASRICHSPSKTALKRSLGISASSCSYKDWIGTDVLVFWGSVAANNQPVSTKYMYAAKKAGTKILLVNPYREPSMEKYWIPSIPESALFGTKLADDIYQVNIGGDIAFINAVIKHWFEMEEINTGSALDLEFVKKYTSGYYRLREFVMNLNWNQLERSSGLSKERIMVFAKQVARAKTGVFIWSMGLTQHRFGTDNVSQVTNLALLKGFIGREKCGVMPIRGHSGVQGAGEMGCDPYTLPGGEFDKLNIERLEKLWGFSIPKWHGNTIGQTIENMNLPKNHPNRTKIFYTSGGNFLETMPNPLFIKNSLEKVELRVHQDIILNTSTLIEAEEVIVLPAMTRYEQPGGGTATSTERMVYFSPEIEGPRIKEARCEWEIYLDLAARVKPDKKELVQVKRADDIRKEIARANPNYDGIQHLKKQGDVFQWGGAWLCEDGNFPTVDHKGQLLPIKCPEDRQTEGYFTLTTRRGKQFNSMIYDTKDPFNGADRFDILINSIDANKLGLKDGDRMILFNQYGTFQGQAKFSNIKSGNLAVYWPEGNTLLPNGIYEAHAKIPDYNTRVAAEKAEIYHARKDVNYFEKRISELKPDMYQ